MASNQERLDSCFSVLKRAREIAGKAMSVPGMSERMSQLAKGFAIVTPCKTEGNLLAFKPIFTSVPHCHQGCLKIYPRFSNDTEVHEDLKSKDFSPNYACYIQLYHKIALNMQSVETPYYTSCCLIHELGHSLVAQHRELTMTNVPSSKSEWVAEEMEMRTFDYKLFLVIGGGGLPIRS